MKTKTSRITALTLLAASALAGCSTDRTPGELFGPSEEGLLVVDAILIVDARLPTIRLSRTVRPDRVPNESQGERGATVVVRTGGHEIPYFGVSALIGSYRPAQDHLVRPQAVYELYVRTRDDEILTATTRTPPRFSVDSWLLLDETDLSIRKELVTFEDAGEGVYEQNRLVYTEGLLEARFQRPDVPAFQIGLSSLDLDSDYVIDPIFFEEEDFEELERQNSSPAFESVDGFARLPWFAIFYEGRHLIRIHALDTNWYDLIRTDAELSGGGPGFGGNTGDSFERPIFHVDGGIGLFGSASSDSIGITILPRP